VESDYRQQLIAVLFSTDSNSNSNSTAYSNAVQHSTAQHTATQYSTAQHSIQQRSTVQHSGIVTNNVSTTENSNHY